MTFTITLPDFRQLRPVVISFMIHSILMTLLILLRLELDRKNALQMAKMKQEILVTLVSKPRTRWIEAQATGRSSTKIGASQTARLGSLVKTAQNVRLNSR